MRAVIQVYAQLITVLTQDADIVNFAIIHDLIGIRGIIEAQKNEIEKTKDSRTFHDKFGGPDGLQW